MPFSKTWELSFSNVNLEGCTILSQSVWEGRSSSSAGALLHAVTLSFVMKIGGSLLFLWLNLTSKWRWPMILSPRPQLLKTLQPIVSKRSFQLLTLFAVVLNDLPYLVNYVLCRFYLTTVYLPCFLLESCIITSPNSTLCPGSSSLLSLAVGQLPK